MPTDLGYSSSKCDVHTCIFLGSEFQRIVFTESIFRDAVFDLQIQSANFLQGKKMLTDDGDGQHQNVIRNLLSEMFSEDLCNTFCVGS